MGLSVVISFRTHSDIRAAMHQNIQQTSIAAGGLDSGPSTQLADNIAAAISEAPQQVAEIIAPWEPLLQKIDKFVELTEKISEVGFLYYYKYVLCETNSSPAQVHPYAKMASSVILSAYKVCTIITEIKRFSHI